MKMLEKELLETKATEDQKKKLKLVNHKCTLIAAFDSLVVLSLHSQ